jgi:thiol:disulfide interchange protein
MKKYSITGIALLCALLANAQQTGSRYNDTLASRPTSPPPLEVNQANKVEAVKQKSDAEIEAEKQAKEKGSNKKQTEVNPEKMAPIVGDTVKKIQPIRRTN